MTEYELWIDESGDFESETQADSSLTPSLAGGILLPRGAFSGAELEYLADPEGKGENHAMEMTYSQARKIVPSALEAVCARGGKLVCFENLERIDYLSNRELYLRVLSAGLCQLVRFLCLSGSFLLDITVAVRYVRNSENGVLNKITPEEYKETLREYISRDFRDNHFILPSDCRISLTVLSARQEVRLELADYACNARLALDSKKYAPVRSRLVKLFDDRYIFHVIARSTEEQIRSLLTAGDVSGALMELFTAREKLDRPKLLHEIFHCFSSLSYRLQRLQLRDFSSALRVYAGRETDFERSENLLETAIETIESGLEKYHIDVQADESFFMIHLALADMFLREGDIIHAKPVMDKLSRDISRMNYRIENLAFLYLYREKKALYEINAMEYETAVQIMQETIDCMRTLIDVLFMERLTSSWFDSNRPPVSEYLGDALCMKIYAELFLQRQDPDLYERSLKTDTGNAMGQYSYPGELERNQQYRSKAENEAGHCREALRWLLKTRDIPLENGTEESSCVRYLAAANKEDIISKSYFIMYYIEIMERAGRFSESGSVDDRALANTMYQALVSEENIMNDLLLAKYKTHLKSDVKEEITIFENLFSVETRARHYHPLEIVLWKYGTFQYTFLGYKKAAERSWADAVKICEENPDYTVLRIVALAILLEQASLMKEQNEPVGSILDKIRNKSAQLKQVDNLPPRMINFLQSTESVLLSPNFSKDALTLASSVAF